MSRSRIIAGKAVIIIEAQDKLDKSLKSIRANLHRLANTAGAVGDQLFKTGFLGAIGSGVAINQFVKFDDILRTLRVNLDLFGKSAQEVDRTMRPLEETIRRLAKTTPFSPSQVGEAAIGLAKGGFSPQQIMDSLQGVLDLSRATRTDLAFTSNFVVRTMSTFQLSTQQTSEVVSQLVRATRKGVLGIDDLEAAMRYASGTADTLGVSLPRLLSFFTYISNRGLVGSIGGTSLNTAFSNLVKKADELEKVMGVNLVSAIRKDGREAIDVFQTLANLFDYTSRLPIAQQVSTFQDIFNLRGARPVAAIRTIDSIRQIFDLSQQISNAGDEARVAAEIMDQGLGGSIRRLVSAVQDLGIALGETASGPLMAIIHGLTDLVNKINELAKTNPLTSAMIILSPAALLGAGAGFIALSKVLRIAAVAAGGFRAAYSPVMGLLTKGTAAQVSGITSLFSKQGPKTLARGKAATLAKQQIGAIKAAELAKQNAVTKIGRAAAAKRLKDSRKALKTTLKSAAARGMRAPSVIASTQKQAKAVTNLAKGQMLLNKAKRLEATVSGGPKNAKYYSVMQQSTRMANKGLAARRLGVKGFQTGTMLKSIVGVGAKLGSIAKGFFTVANAARRFVFSFGGILTILEGILLFTDIPNMFGRGFVNAFRAIGNTVKFAQGPLEQFKLAYQAFVGGDTDVGITALTRGFQNLVGIIGNQLVAAWNRFKEAIAPIWDFFRALGTTLMVTIDSIIGSIGNLFKSFAGAGKSILDLLPGGSGGALDFVKNVGQAIALIIPELFSWIDRLAVTFETYFTKFIADLEYFASTFFTGDAMGTKEARRKDKRLQADLNDINRRREINNKLEQRQKDIMESFARSAAEEGKTKANQAANKSFGLMLQSIKDAQEGFAELNRRRQKEQMEEAQRIARQNQVRGAMQDQLTPQRQQVQRAIMQMLPYASALVTSAQSARGNLLQLGKPIEQKQLEEQQRTNELLEGMSRDQGVIFAE